MYNFCYKTRLQVKEVSIFKGFVNICALKNTVSGFVCIKQNEEVLTVSELSKLESLEDGTAFLLCDSRLFKGLSGRVLDVLELFAFVYPAQSPIPTIKSLLSFLGLKEAVNSLEECKSLFLIKDKLLERLSVLPDKEKQTMISLAKVMGDRGGWTWASIVLDTLGFKDKLVGLTGFAVWETLTEWEDREGVPPAGTAGISEKEVSSRLAELLKENLLPEARKEQSDYALGIIPAFCPREVEDEPTTILAEAGTGVGKTLGYIAPASVWADKNAGSVWISTYTKNLQRQLDRELSKLYPNETEKRRNIVIRKGRENYICLFNYAEAVSRLFSSPANVVVPLGLVARWLSHTNDGDISEGDFPAWLSDLLGSKVIKSLNDKRGECIYSACSYYKKCFIEKVIRRSRRAKIVVANHALVMAQALANRDDEGASFPTRYIFDEGHHLFQAADSAFSTKISGLEASEIRRWLFGSEERIKHRRHKGLRGRLEDITLTYPDVASFLSEALHFAEFLPKYGWLSRVSGKGRTAKEATSTPEGSFEVWLSLVYKEVKARSDSISQHSYTQECEPFPLPTELKSATEELISDIAKVVYPLEKITKFLNNKLEKEAGELETSDKQRYEGTITSLNHKVLEPFTLWSKMLKNLCEDKAKAGEIVRFVIDKTEGYDIDVGFCHNYINPMPFFAEIMKGAAHGIVITSATLKDRGKDMELNWQRAEERTGAKELSPNPQRLAIKSPFDYPLITKVFIIKDVNKNDVRSVASAMRALFQSVGGGALGLFTSIERLKAVEKLIHKPLKESGIKLFSQHIDEMNTATLIDMFKDDEDSCLLGTDAVRDGIDVPSRSLRLLVFDRVPWTKPDIIHKARRQAFGGEEYEKMLVRGRLSQAYGRLIRAKGDKGALVILDGGCPSSLLSAFPSGVEVLRVNLKETISMLKEWL